MSTAYDVISVGGGHHGLVVAAYMAKAGRTVLVLERNSVVGGGCVITEAEPGFLFDEHSIVLQVILSNSLIRYDELGCGRASASRTSSRRSRSPRCSTTARYSPPISAWTTPRAIAEFSAADADSYRRFSDMAAPVFPMKAGALFAPAVPLGAMMSRMGQSANGGELLFMSLRSGLDIVSEWFGHEKVRMHFVKLMTENLQMPGRRRRAWARWQWSARRTGPGWPAARRVGDADRSADRLHPRSWRRHHDRHRRQRPRARRRQGHRRPHVRQTNLRRA